MDKEVKVKWLEALRSGEYKQGKLALHDIGDNTYCCLGVLCETLYIPSDVKGIYYFHESEDPTEVEHDGKYYESQDHESIPGQFMGVSQQNINHLIEMNDDGNYSFKTIADWIELTL